MPNICEELIREIRLDDIQEEKKTTETIEKIREKYIVLLIQAAIDSEHIDKGALWEAKCDLSLPDQYFLNDAQAISDWFRLTNLAKNAPDAVKRMIAAREKMHAIEKQFKIDLKNARHDLGEAETAHGEASSALQKIRELGQHFPDLFECIKEVYRPRGYCPADTDQSPAATGELPTAIDAEKQESAAPSEKSTSDPAIPRFEPPPDDLPEIKDSTAAQEQEGAAPAEHAHPDNSEYPFDHIVTPEKEAQKKKSKKSVSI